ncbi:MAG: ABC transporter permease, partial [Pseudomonadales bacterium]|nr:ABC transporter permease [Pseudomonadales bacterium]
MSDLSLDASQGRPAIAARPHSGFNFQRFRKITEVGLKSIVSHGLRSLLTVLGIVIGVAAVIAMLAVSEGASFEAQQQFRDLGASNILLKSVKPVEVEQSSNQGFGPPQAIVYGLTEGDIRSIQATIPGVTNVIASRIVKKNVWNLGRSMNTDIVGTSVDYPVSRNYNLRAGRFFSQSELRDHANVVVLSDEVSQQLFPIDNPLGQSLRIDGDYYNIVGIMESEGFSNLGQNQAGSSNAAPSRVFMPITSVRSRFGETTTRQTAGGVESETVELHEAIIQVDNQDTVIEIGEVIEQILAR